MHLQGISFHDHFKENVSNMFLFATDMFLLLVNLSLNVENLNPLLEQKIFIFRNMVFSAVSSICIYITNPIIN